MSKERRGNGVTFKRTCGTVVGSFFFSPFGEVVIGVVVIATALVGLLHSIGPFSTKPGKCGDHGLSNELYFYQFCFSFMLHICALFQVHLQFNPPFFFTVAPLRNRIGRTHQFEQPRSSESGSLKNMTRRMCFIVCVPLQRHSPGRAYPIHPLLSPPPSLLFF